MVNICLVIICVDRLKRKKKKRKKKKKKKKKPKKEATMSDVPITLSIFIERFFAGGRGVSFVVGVDQTPVVRHATSIPELDGNPRAEPSEMIALTRFHPDTVGRFRRNEASVCRLAASRAASTANGNARSARIGGATGLVNAPKIFARLRP